MRDFVIKSWEGLRQPGIDPFEYPEELPQYLREVAKAAEEEAETVDQIAEFYGKNAGAFKECVDYMERAAVVPAVIDKLVEADEAIEAAWLAFREGAERLGEAADLVEAAQAEAEAEYGDRDVPRFDRASMR